MKLLNLIDKAFLLKKTSLFGSLDLDFLLTISDKMELLHYPQNEKIIQFDQNAHRMYLIVEGKVKIHDKQGQKLAELGNGEFFGDEGMFGDRTRAYEAMCVSFVSLLALSRSHLHSIIDECPSVALALLEAYSTHIDFRKR